MEADKSIETIIMHHTHSEIELSTIRMSGEKVTLKFNWLQKIQPKKKLYLFRRFH